MAVKIFTKVIRIFNDCLYHIVLSLPDELNKIRIFYYNLMGCNIKNSSTISSNVRIRGNVIVGEKTSIAQNCTISSDNALVKIGNDVMIAPNVTIVAFGHCFDSRECIMRDQTHKLGNVIIEDDVWIGANCTIGFGVTIGKGAIVSANSFVRTGVTPYSIVSGVPAKQVSIRPE